MIMYVVNFPEDDDLDIFSDCSIEELLPKTSRDPDQYECFDREELIKMLHKRDEELATANAALDHLVNTSQYRLSTGNSLWVLRFDPANPPSNDILEEISKKYLKGEDIIAVPNNYSLDLLNEDDLANIGLKRVPRENESVDDYYDRMFRKGCT